MCSQSCTFVVAVNSILKIKGPERESHFQLQNHFFQIILKGVVTSSWRMNPFRVCNNWFDPILFELSCFNQCSSHVTFELNRPSFALQTDKAMTASLRMAVSTDSFDCRILGEAPNHGTNLIPFMAKPEAMNQKIIIVKSSIPQTTPVK